MGKLKESEEEVVDNAGKDEYCELVRGQASRERTVALLS